MTSFIFISIPIFVLVFYVLLKFLKRGKEKINEPSVGVKTGRKCDDNDASSGKVNDSLEKAEEVERIEFERENEKKLNESQPENIPRNICFERNQDEIPIFDEKIEDNFLEKSDGKTDAVPLKENYENILPKENVINPEDLLNRFTGYIYRNKLAKIEDISISLKSDMKETVNKLRDIEIQGNTTGFLDDKGFYMSLNERELDV
jgi:hypothetical protein